MVFKTFQTFWEDFEKTNENNEIRDNISLCFGKFREYLWKYHKNNGKGGSNWYNLKKPHNLNNFKNNKVKKH